MPNWTDDNGVSHFNDTRTYYERMNMAENKPNLKPLPGRNAPPSRPGARPAAKPAAAAKPQRRGDFLRGVVPGADRLPAHYEVRGRYACQLDLVDYFRNRDDNANIFRAEFTILEVIGDDGDRKERDRFNILFSSKNMDVYKSEMAKCVFGLCKPSEEELAADAELEEADQTLMLDLFDKLCDGEFIGNVYDLTFTPAKTKNGKDVTRIRYGDIVQPPA